MTSRSLEKRQISDLTEMRSLVENLLTGNVFSKPGEDINCTGSFT